MSSTTAGETGAARAALRPRRLEGLRLVGAVATLTVAYVALGRLGLSLAHYQHNATLVWPPTGLALAALVLHGRRLWPGAFLGALVVNLLVGSALTAALAIALGNTLEAVAGAWLLERLRFHPGFSRLRDVLVFGLVVLGCTTISATIGTAGLGAAGALAGRDPRLVWLIWWLGDVGGAVLVAPLLLVGLRGRPSWAGLARRLESWLVLSLLALVTVASFFGLFAAKWLALFLGTLPFPFLIWAGLRLGPRGAVLGAAVVAALAVIGTAAGHGPFVAQTPQESLLALWAYALAMGASAVILAAAVAERDDAEAARRAAEEARAAVQTQMEHTQRLESLGVLAGGIAHDFNNLLLAIRGNAELLSRQLAADERAARRLGEIEHATSRAADLCRQLLDYAGKNVRRPRPLGLAALVDDVLRLVAGSVPEGVRVEVDRGVDVPDVMGDAPQLRQVVMNLLLNAVEALEGGDGEVRVRLAVVERDHAWLAHTFLASEAAPGRFVALVVEDTGIGMDAATLERLFEPFFTTKAYGRGLGMAAVAGIVKAHGGAVKVTSAPGEGTRFEVCLPA